MSIIHLLCHNWLSYFSYFSNISYISRQTKHPLFNQKDGYQRLKKKVFIHKKFKIFLGRLNVHTNDAFISNRKSYKLKLLELPIYLLNTSESCSVIWSPMLSPGCHFFSPVLSQQPPNYSSCLCPFKFHPSLCGPILEPKLPGRTTQRYWVRGSCS